MQKPVKNLSLFKIQFSLDKCNILNFIHKLYTFNLEDLFITNDYSMFIRFIHSIRDIMYVIVVQMQLHKSIIGLPSTVQVDFEQQSE